MKMNGSEGDGGSQVVTRKTVSCGYSIHSEDGKVETFVKTVIEAASGGASCPVSPSPSTTSSRQSSHWVEETLGSLGNLPREASPADKHFSGVPSSKKSVVLNLHPNLKNRVSSSSRTSKKNKESGHRQNLLVRRNDSPLKSLSPADLGSVILQSQQSTVISLNNSNTAVIESEVVVSPASTEHLSSFHLRKPISTYENSKISSATNDNDNPAQAPSSSLGSKNSPSPRPSPIQTPLVNAQDSPILTGESVAESPVKPEKKNTDLEKVCVHHYHQHSHHHHHHYHDSFKKHDDEALEKEPESPVSPPTLASPNDLHEIAFYRKFSATSPTIRSKSSLAWPAAITSDSNNLVIGYCSKFSEKMKSRSTPIKLDMLASTHFPHLVEYGCVCGTFCYFCCQEVSCNCSCDDCCCRRQLSHMRPSSKLEERARSRSLESLALHSRHEELDEQVGDEVLDDAEAFIDTHLLQHLQLSDSDDNNYDGLDYEGGEQEDVIQDDQVDQFGHEDDVVYKTMKMTPGSCQHRIETKIVVENNNSDFHNDEEVDNEHNSNESGRSRAGGQSPFASKTSIVIVRETPTPRSSRSSSRRSRLRVANGEVRPSFSEEGIGDGGSSPEVGRVSEPRISTSAANRLTVTMDSMSLFLDAVHVHMRHGLETP